MNTMSDDVGASPGWTVGDETTAHFSDPSYVSHPAGAGGGLSRPPSWGLPASSLEPAPELLSVTFSPSEGLPFMVLRGDMSSVVQRRRVGYGGWLTRKRIC